MARADPGGEQRQHRQEDRQRGRGDRERAPRRAAAPPLSRRRGGCALSVIVSAASVAALATAAGARSHRAGRRRGGAVTAAGAGPGWAARAAASSVLPSRWSRWCECGRARSSRALRSAGALPQGSCACAVARSARWSLGRRSSRCAGQRQAAPARSPAPRAAADAGARALAATRRSFVAYDVDRAPDHLGPYLGGGLLKLSRRGGRRGAATQRVRSERAGCERRREGRNSCCDFAAHRGLPAGVLHSHSAPCTATGALAHGKALAKLSVVAFAPARGLRRASRRRRAFAGEAIAARSSSSGVLRAEIRPSLRSRPPTSVRRVPVTGSMERRR